MSKALSNSFQDYLILLILIKIRKEYYFFHYIQRFYCVKLLNNRHEFRQIRLSAPRPINSYFI